MAMMKLGGISLEKEAVNSLLDKVGEPYVTSCVNHVSDAPFAGIHTTSLLEDNV